MTARVIGIDPSLTGTGLSFHQHSLRWTPGCTESEVTVAGQPSSRTLVTKAEDGDGRLEYIAMEVEILASVYGRWRHLATPYAVMEDLPFNAMQAGTTGMVQGVVRLALMRQGIPYAFLSPATLKKFATDNGRATKEQMAEALLEHYGIALLRKKDNNEVDAHWLRIAGEHWLGLDHTLDSRLSVLKTGKWWKDNA